VKKQPLYITEKALFDEFKQQSSENDIPVTNNAGAFELAGFDVKSGLIRLGGNQKLYRKLLVKFHENHKNEINNIRQALDHNDVQAAERLAHTIKGAAGNLGAQEVSTAASALEVEFRTNKLDNVEPLMERFEQALEKAFTSTALLEENNEEISALETNGADVLPLIPLFDELAKLLNDNDMAASEYIEEIISKVQSTTLYDEAVKIKGFIDQYDFVGALVVLNEMLIRERNNNGKGH
jgi:polar amino acid transport system substrate-binding protein